MRSRTIIRQSGRTATGIQVPNEVVEALGAGRRPAVKGTINGYTYRSTVAVMGGASMISLSAEHRAAAGVAGGEEVDLDIDLDTAPREVSVPADFAAALDAEPEARRTFDACPTATSPGTCCRSRRQDRADTAAPHRQVGRHPEAGPRPLRRSVGEQSSSVEALPSACVIGANSLMYGPGRCCRHRPGSLYAGEWQRRPWRRRRCSRRAGRRACPRWRWLG